MWSYPAQESECEDPCKVNEEAILDSLFYSCDPEDRGRVPVSRLIEYLRSTICGESGEVSKISRIMNNYLYRSMDTNSFSTYECLDRLFYSLLNAKEIYQR